MNTVLGITHFVFQTLLALQEVLFLVMIFLWCLVSTKRSQILEKTCSFTLQVLLSMCDLFVETKH